MERTSRLRRGIAALVLVLSTAVAALLPIADAYAEAASADPQAHVEQPGSPSCPPVHDEIACQLCRGLKLIGSGNIGAAPISWLTADISTSVSPEELPQPSRWQPSTSPRAPPAV